MVQQWKRWCRLCARDDHSDSHVNIFLKNNDTSQFSDVVDRCFAINIRVQDGLPQSICLKCCEFINALIDFSKKATKVQAMYLEFLENVGDFDPEQLKAQSGIQELDDVDLKVFTNSTDGQGFESKADITPDIIEQKLDPEEFKYLDDELYNSTSIKMENLEEDTNTVDEKIWTAENHLPSVGDKLDEYLSLEAQAESEDSETIPKKRQRGRPKKYTFSQRKKEDSNFTCKDCGKTFSRFPNFRNHMQLEHGISFHPQRFPCTECNKVFSSPAQLQDHSATHSPVEHRPTEACSYCGKEFLKAKEVQEHVNSVHMGEKPFICEECGKACRTSGALKEHKLIHTDEHLFKCTRCDKLFKSKARLKRHEDTHNETNYICTICGLQLNTRRTLNMHMVVHSDQKRHKCNFCGNEYKRAKALKIHLILHTGLKPYTCNFCDKTFANGSNCRSHKKKAHPMELAALEAAGKKCVSATNIPKLEQLRAVNPESSNYLE